MISANFSNVQGAGTHSSSALYINVEQIGEGTYGKVYKAIHRESGREVALKKLLVHNEQMGLPLTALREIKILRELSHPNMVKLHEVVTSIDAESQKGRTSEIERRGSYFLVLEYVEHDLAGLIDMQYRFSPAAIKFIIKQLIEVLSHLHENRYVHRDIKCSNLLIDNYHRLKLADFGLARRLCTDHSSTMTNKVITLWYRPPELLLGATGYGPPVDMWGVGCILAELIIGKPMFPGKTDIEQLDIIFNKVGSPTESTWPGYSDLPNVNQFNLKKKIGNVLHTYLPEAAKKGRIQEAMTPEGVDFIVRLLTLDPQRRMGAKTALDTRYFLAQPKCPANHLELGPLELSDPSQSFHEFQTKKLRKKEAAQLTQHNILESRNGGPREETKAKLKRDVHTSTQ